MTSKQHLRKHSHIYQQINYATWTVAWGLTNMDENHCIPANLQKRQQLWHPSANVKTTASIKIQRTPWYIGRESGQQRDEARASRALGPVTSPPKVSRNPYNTRHCGESSDSSAQRVNNPQAPQNAFSDFQLSSGCL